MAKGHKKITRSLILVIVLMGWSLPVQGKPGPMGGSEIMAEVFRRHKSYPHVYEEQTMILTDDEGRRDTRKMRRFFRITPDLTMRFLMALDYPAAVRGVILKSVKHNGQEASHVIYLPGLDRGFSPGVEKKERGVMGTDFSREEFMEDLMSDTYVRKKDQVINRVPYFIVEATPEHGGLRVHFIRQDIFFIARTDFYTRGNRLHKRMTRHDLKKADKQMWRAGMVLMENLLTGHKTLIKTDKRIFSRDYVPPEIFLMDWSELNNYLWPGRDDSSSESTDDQSKAETE